MKEIELTQGKKAFVDDDDYDYLRQRKWYYHDNSSSLTGYARTNVRINGKRTSTTMHREIMIKNFDLKKDQVVDHIDHNGINNQKSNLRICNFDDNLKNNSSRKGSSKYLGVYFHKVSGKWAASIQINKKQKHLGVFNSEIEAAHVFDFNAKLHYGAFANLNFKKSA